MPTETEPQAKKVGWPKGKPRPPRNNLKSSVLYKTSRANQIQGEDKDFVYEWKTTHEDHPGSLKNTGQLHEHEFGSDLGGYVMLPGWQVVQRAAGDKADQAEAREDQGKPIDTLVRRGKQILCKMHKSEHAKYRIAEEARQNELERQMYQTERQGDKDALMSTSLSRDENADHIQMLKRAGHTMPGS